MLRVRFEPTISVLERVKTFGVLDRAAIMISATFRPDLGPTQRPVERVLEAVSPEVNQPRRETNQPPPSSAEVKNYGAIPPFPVRCHDVLHTTGARRTSRDQRFTQLPCS
jgi:hypothetical protein